MTCKWRLHVNDRVVMIQLKDDIQHGVLLLDRSTWSIHFVIAGYTHHWISCLFLILLFSSSFVKLSQGISSEKSRSRGVKRRLANGWIKLPIRRSITHEDKESSSPRVIADLLLSWCWKKSGQHFLEEKWTSATELHCCEFFVCIFFFWSIKLE